MLRLWRERARPRRSDALSGSAAAKKNVQGLQADALDCKSHRQLRGLCKVARFCCKAHQDMCLMKTTKVMSALRRGREQVVCVFHVLRNALSAPWASVLLLLQLHLGDSVDCSRQAYASWFVNLHSTTDLPAVDIAKVNGKTKPRPASYAKLLWEWISEEALGGSLKLHRRAGAWQESARTKKDGSCSSKAVLASAPLSAYVATHASEETYRYVTFCVQSRVCSARLKVGHHFLMGHGLFCAASPS